MNFLASLLYFPLKIDIKFLLRTVITHLAVNEFSSVIIPRLRALREHSDAKFCSRSRFYRRGSRDHPLGWVPAGGDAIQLFQCSSFGTLGNQLPPFADNVTFVEYSRARKGGALWDREHFLCLPPWDRFGSSLELEGRALKSHILARIVSVISPVSFRV